MKVIEKKWKHQLPISLKDAWQFFSRPENLNEITPEDMEFNILSDIRHMDMYEGMIIRYRIRPLLNIPMNWVTEITHIEDHKYFIDEQRFGPYKFWHHQHHFEENEWGTLMTDHLHYAIPLGLIGNLMDTLFINRQIDHIFDYRKIILTKRFNLVKV